MSSEKCNDKKNKKQGEHLKEMENKSMQSELNEVGLQGRHLLRPANTRVTTFPIFKFQHFI